MGHRVFSDFHIAQNGAANTDVHSVANCRKLTQIMARGYAERGVLADQNIISDRPRGKHHAPEMLELHAPANHHGIAKVDAAHPLGQLEGNTIENRKRNPQGTRADVHPGVAEPMPEQRPEPLAEQVPVMRAIVFGNKCPKPYSAWVAVFRAVIDVRCQNLSRLDIRLRLT